MTKVLAQFNSSEAILLQQGCHTLPLGSIERRRDWPLLPLCMRGPRVMTK